MHKVILPESPDHPIVDRFPFRSVMPLLCFLIVGAIGHVIIPPLAYHHSPKDADMGIWFCGGVLLAELSMIDLLAWWRFGPLQWRVLAAMSLVVLLVELAIQAVWLCARMSTQDVLSLLQLLYGSSLFFALADAIFFGLFHLAIGRRQPTSLQLDSERRSASSRQFGTLFMLAAVVLSAWIALKCRQALSLQVEAYHSFRNYYNHGAPLLLLMLTFFWVLHLCLLRATVAPSVRSGVWASIAVGIVGTELIRRVEQWKNTVVLDYLNWEFSMIVLGFITGHAVVGATIRWLGWEIKTVRQSSEYPIS